MNSIILNVVDGKSFFVGLTMTLVANLLIFYLRTRPIRIVLTTTSITGIIFVVISATPLPVWAYALWLIVVAVALIMGNLARFPRSIQRNLVGFLVVTTATFGLAEFPHHRLPHMTVPHGTTVYVLGDSISAGIGTKEKCWPSVLAGMTSFSVVNLAQPGATVQGALKQAEGITEPHATVILEIGGNDILSGTGAATFRNQLDILVSLLRSHQHSVLMIELPLFPFQNAFGMAQRSAATKHGALLLPKRYFASVLGMENGTLDGLHLSQEGHDAMAKIMVSVIQER